LESQRELDQSRIQAQTEKLAKILNLHREYKNRYGALKKQLHQYQEENETLEVRVAELEECKEQVAELSEHNRFLEDKMIEMCKVAESDEDGNQRVRVLGQQMEEKQRECEMLTKENKDLRERATQLDSQMTKRIGDVWQQLDHAQQQRVQKEVELQHANQMLQDQVANNQALRKQLRESMDGLNREITCQERKIKELTSKAVQRLQRIRMLEAQTTIKGTGHATLRSERMNATLQESGQNNVEIAVHGASLAGVSEGTKSFILLDFHSFASEVSEVVSGVNPNYDFIVIYDMTEADDGALSHLLAGSFVRAELYVLREEEAPPTLIACASAPTSALLNPLAQSRSSALELIPPRGGGDAVGSLDLSMRLARPISAIHTPPRMMDEMAAGAAASGGQRAVPDAITISLLSANLSRGKVLFGYDDPFYVHYRFIARDATTNLARADSRGAISFQHTSTFPILSADDGSVEPVLWALSRVTMQFTLFSGGRRENERGEWEEGGGYRIVGRARVPLSDVWVRANTTTTAEIISSEAKIVGSMAVTFETTARPAFGVDGASRDSMRRSAHSRFVELLTEVASTIEGEDPSGTVGAYRLLRFVDPPAGILRTAESIRRLMVARFRGKSLSDVVLSLPPPPRRPDENDDDGGGGVGRTRASEYARRTEDARVPGALLAGFPPDEEMEDLLHHLSGGDGRVRPSDLDYFAASETVRTLAGTFRTLGRMKKGNVGEDLLRAAIGGRREADTAIWRRNLSACVAELFGSLSDAELIHLTPLIRDLA
jgi:hypothetical protein